MNAWRGDRARYSRIDPGLRLGNWAGRKWLDKDKLYSGTPERLLNCPEKRYTGELKYIDVLPFSSTISLEGSIDPGPLNAIQQGPDLNMRIGRKICMRSILIRVSMTGVIFDGDTSSFPQDVLMRFLLVYDLQTNGGGEAHTPPSVATILQPALQPPIVIGTAQVPNANMNYLSSINMDFTDRFVIVFDDMTILTALQTQSWEIYRYMKLRTEVRYLNEGVADYTVLNGDFSSIATGSLFLLRFMSQPAIGTNPPITYTCRIRYTDA